MLEKAQDAEKDRRDAVKEAALFLTERDGQWDQISWQKMDGRFRGTFDMCTPIVDGISGEIDQADFSLRVRPSGGIASEDTAKVIDGLIRNIRNISNAENVFNKSARRNIVSGFDAWEVVQDWVDGNSFDQDLFIRWIPNASDAVWFDLASTEPDRSDANWGIKLIAIPTDDYRAKWPEGSEISIGDNARRRAIQQTIKESVTIGKLYYRKPVIIELVRMTDGTVYEDNEDFQKVKDELEQQGITIEVDENGEEKRRKRESWRVWSRMLDGADWLAEEEETVFDYIPLIPIYGNFDIIENRCVYFGLIEKLFDEQRVLNYAMSRDIEDGAFSPARQTWMTDEQAAGNDYQKMNTDRNPVRIYNHIDGQPTPFETGGPVASSGLQTTIANMQDMINTTSNTFRAQQGNASSTQSGIAGIQQIEQGNIGSMKWFKALELAICHTGRVIINGALGRVYDGTRQARLLNEDGTTQIVNINKTVFDQQTQQNIVLNDLSVGEYDVVCEMGPAFNSAQKEAARSFETIAQIAPDSITRNVDIYFKNRSEPGMDLMAERERAVLFQAGQIPESQWTDEERQQVAEAQALAQQEQQPDPAMVLAQAELVKGQAEQQNADNKTLEIQGDQAIKAEELRLRGLEIELDIAKFNREKDDKFNVDAAKINQGQQKLDLQQQKQIIDAQNSEAELILKAQKQSMDEQQQQIENLIALQEQQREEIASAINDLKTLREAIGVDTIVGPHNMEAYVNQAVEVTDIQEDQGIDTGIGEEVTGSEE
jgi:hypothetical protein